MTYFSEIYCFGGRTHSYMIAKLGVLGGMFDPVHNGHIDAARYAKDLLSLDLVNLIPCNIPNHKVQSYAPAEDRLAMIELAIRDESGIEVDDIELQRPSVSYLSLIHI